MDEMRSEIRSAFEREQAAHLPAQALRRDILDAVAAHQRAAPNVPWVAVAAAVILGLLVVVGLMSTRFIHVLTPAGKPVVQSPVVVQLPVMDTSLGVTMIPLTFGTGAQNFGAFSATGQSLFLEFACRSSSGSAIRLTLTTATSGGFVASASRPCVGPDFTIDEFAGFKGHLVLTIDASVDTEWEVYVASGPVR